MVRHKFGYRIGYLAATKNARERTLRALTLTSRLSGDELGSGSPTKCRLSLVLAPA
jgi:hypothetical protein